MRSSKESSANRFSIFQLILKEPTSILYMARPLKKHFFTRSEYHALVNYEGVETTYLEGYGLDKQTGIVVNFHKRRLTEDQNLFVREGDFVRYGDIYYEIVKLSEPKQLFGQIEHRFEVTATCTRARDGVFNGE